MCVLITCILSCSTNEDRFNVSIQPAVGELLLPVTMSEKDFDREQGNTSTYTQMVPFTLIFTSVKF